VGENSTRTGRKGKKGGGGGGGGGGRESKREFGRGRRENGLTSLKSFMVHPKIVCKVKKVCNVS
jgi:hypothetical protein